MTYIEQEDYRQAIERYLIKLERKKQNITLEDLSKKIGKTKQYLSEIETGKKYNQKVIQILFSSLNIHFNFDYSEAFQIINDFNDFVHFYISMNKTERLKKKDILLQEKYQHSYFYPIYILTKFIDCRLILDEEKIKKYSELCDDVLDLFTDSQKSIYYYFLGSYQLYDLNDCKLGEINLNKSAHFDSNGEILGMTYNQLGIVKLESHHLHEAYLLQIKSREILQKFNCYKRLVYPELTLGDILLQKQLKDEAEAQYLRTIQLCKQLGNVRTMNIAFSNLAYGMMTMVHDYSKAIYYCQQLIDVDEYKQLVYYILSWSYYSLKESKEAQYYLSLLNDVNNHQSLEIDTYAIGLNYLLEGKHELYYQKLLNYYNQIKDDFKTYDKIVVLEKLIEYCGKHQKYKEGYYFQQEYIQVIKIV